MLKVDTPSVWQRDMTDGTELMAARENAKKKRKKKKNRVQSFLLFYFSQIFSVV